MLDYGSVVAENSPCYQEVLGSNPAMCEAFLTSDEPFISKSITDILRKYGLRPLVEYSLCNQAVMGSNPAGLFLLSEVSFKSEIFIEK